ncbi:MAG: substrate-binding and VWA domain-containing protein [Spirochaetes bacterium]|nr:substrate-binding and VWA domain-containing protein [Spirochaetota bacterium]
MIKKWIPLLIVVIALIGLTQCAKVLGGSELSILSGSENKELEPLLEKFYRQKGIKIHMHYKGSIDIMRLLNSGKNIEYDAVWPANSLWIALGDKHRVVKHDKSIMTSPVVFGVKKSLAQKLGLMDKEIYVKDILHLIREQEIDFIMTSATQSNSGASAYMGFLYALLDNPEVITSEDLKNDQLRDDIKELLSGINRSSGSSGWLKELYIKGDYNAMVNYEAMIIEANHHLSREGREPLYAIYPVDGIVIADSPLGYINKGDGKKEEAFLALQDYLLSEKVQDEILKLGRRTGFGGVVENPDQKIFNPDWGIQADRAFSPIKMPAANTIYEALTLYQTEFKKPACTIYCLDYSGSMQGEGERELEKAMELILDQQKATEYLIQSNRKDITIIIPFNSNIITDIRVDGNDYEQLLMTLKKVKKLRAGGGTNIYLPAMEGLNMIKENGLAEDYLPSIVIMTDGKSEDLYSEFRQTWQSMGMDVPVFSITFASADPDQLEMLSELTNGRVFDGRHDLVNAFRKVKGYN